MTTSTDSGGALPGIIEAERSIDVLLKESATTYQHMTDEEIERLMDYRCDLAAHRAVSEHDSGLVTEMMSAADERVRERAADARERFEQLRAMRVEFITVDPETGLAVRND